MTTDMNLTIRSENDDDLESIRQVNRLAFGQDDEANFVDAIRDGGFVRSSLVAELDDQVVGHILFSGIPARPERHQEHPPGGTRWTTRPACV